MNPTTRGARFAGSNRVWYARQTPGRWHTECRCASALAPRRTRRSGVSASSGWSLTVVGGTVGLLAACAQRRLAADTQRARSRGPRQVRSAVPAPGPHLPERSRLGGRPEGAPGIRSPRCRAPRTARRLTSTPARRTAARRVALSARSAPRSRRQPERGARRPHRAVARSPPRLSGSADPPATSRGGQGAMLTCPGRGELARHRSCPPGRSRRDRTLRDRERLASRVCPIGVSWHHGAESGGFPAPLGHIGRIRKGPRGDADPSPRLAFPPGA